MHFHTSLEAVCRNHRELWEEFLVLTQVVELVGMEGDTAQCAFYRIDHRTQEAAVEDHHRTHDMTDLEVVDNVPYNRVQKGPADNGLVQIQVGLV